MDWIRFSKSGKDLTGLRGRLIEVTNEELQKHNSRNDCWTSIRGMVYNVTPYMDYHPGGEDELMKAAGIDGTDLFEQVHRWVNYESMLKACLVGRMATKPITAIKEIPRPQPVFIPSNQVVPLAVKDSRPRYDWFQTAETVHLVIYAERKVLNTGCTVVDLKDGILRVEVLLGKMSYIIHLRLSENVDKDIAVQTAFSVGKIQVTIYKQAEEKWSSCGQPLEFHDTFLAKKDRGLFFRDCMLVSKTELNHNTHMFQLQLPSGSAMHVPVGAHIYFKSIIQDVEVVRPYTPVDQGLSVGPNNSSENNNLSFMIKIYPDGVFTRHLNSLCLVLHSAPHPECSHSAPLRIHCAPLRSASAVLHSAPHPECSHSAPLRIHCAPLRSASAVLPLRSAPHPQCSTPLRSASAVLHSTPQCSHSAPLQIRSAPSPQRSRSAPSPIPLPLRSLSAAPPLRSLSAPSPLPLRSLSAPSPLPLRSLSAPSPLPLRSLSAPSPLPLRSLSAPSPLPLRSLSAPSPLPLRSLSAPSPLPHRSLSAPSPLPHRSLTAPTPAPLPLHSCSTPTLLC
ncbi:cytochrome b5 reductase 4 isoform X2 [Stigmatopora argus]